jgi:hypothetical protein
MGRYCKQIARERKKKEARVPGKGLLMLLSVTKFPPASTMLGNAENEQQRDVPQAAPS